MEQSDFKKYIGKHIRITIYRGFKNKRKQARVIEGILVQAKYKQLFVADIDPESNPNRHKGKGIWIPVPRYKKDIVEIIERVQGHG